MSGENNGAQSGEQTQVEASGTSRVSEIFLLGFILAIVSQPLASLALSHISSRFWHWVVDAVGYGFEHLGVVLVVAMLVRVAIEKASQREFVGLVNNKVREQVRLSIEDIAKTSLAPLQGSMRKLDEELGFTIRRPGLLDKESMEELKKKVLNPEFFRSDYTLQLVLEPFSGVNDPQSALLRVRVRSTYKVRNITKARAAYLIEAWVDTMLEPPGIAESEACQFTRFAYGPDDARSESELRPFDLLKLATEGRILRKDGGLWLHHDIQGGIPAETTYYVDIEALQVMRTQDTFLWNMGGLTSRLTIGVGFGNGIKSEDFQVDARELHHVGHEIFRKSFSDRDNVLSWSINQVLLPYQGVEIWWSPRRSK